MIVVVIMAAIVVMMMVMTVIMRVPMVVRGVMIVLMPMVVIRTVVMVMIMRVVVREPMRVGVDAGNFTSPARIGLHPLGSPEQRERPVERCLLLGVARRVLKTDQVEAGNLQLQAQIAAIHGQVTRSHTVHMGRVLALHLSQGKPAGEDWKHREDQNKTSRHAKTP